MLAPRQVTTVQRAGFRGLKNGNLLAALEGAFEVFVTADKNLRYQQNLTGRNLSIVELLLRPLKARILGAIDSSKPSSYFTVIAEPDGPANGSQTVGSV